MQTLTRHSPYIACVSAKASPIRFAWASHCDGSGFERKDTGFDCCLGVFAIQAVLDVRPASAKVRARSYVVCGYVSAMHTGAVRPRT